MTHLHRWQEWSKDLGPDLIRGLDQTTNGQMTACIECGAQLLIVQAPNEHHHLIFVPPCGSTE
jgi:hypothetical protein